MTPFAPFRVGALVAGLMSIAASSPSSAPRVIVGATERLCVLAGVGARAAAGQEKLRVYGTDMGLSYVKDGRLEILFGDTWSSPTLLAANAAIPRDDAYGSIDLKAFPDGDAVEAYCAKGRGAAPPIRYGQADETTFATLDPGFAMDGLKTPVSAFSSSRVADGQEFAIFVTGKPVTCERDRDCGEFRCDTGLGYVGKPPNEMDRGLTFPCVDGERDCTAQTRASPAPSGLCRDPGSSVAKVGDGMARKMSVVFRHYVGLRSQVPPRDRYSTTVWVTNRFINPVAVTVNDFDPDRPQGIGNDYATADGAHPAHEKVFVWGRPYWSSLNVRGHNLQLYLAYVDMPVPRGGRFDWRPQYFTGLDDHGRPRFSPDQTRAASLDLSGGRGDPAETYDVVDQMTVRWVPQLKSWVMLYGGGLPISAAICRNREDECRDLRPAGAAVRIRTAANPWGPWSTPQDVLVGGDPAKGPVAGSQYGPGGLLHHPDCRGPDCAPNTPPGSVKDTGTLYAANLIEPWTERRPDGSVDLYWNVSSWDPYRVMLMKTRVRLSGQ